MCWMLDAEGRVANPRAYVFAIIDAWRAAVKRRDIFASPGTRYGDPRRGMLDGATWQASKLVVCRALNRSLDAETEIAALSQLIDGAYRTAANRAASNPDLRFETVDGKTRIVVTPLDRLEDTEGLCALRPAVQGRMPKAGMPDLFLEIMQRTGFAKAFTHLSERQARVEHFDTSLCAALVAEACNIGIEAVSRQDVPALRRERLAWVSQNFIRPEPSLPPVRGSCPPMRRCRSSKSGVPAMLPRRTACASPPRRAPSMPGRTRNISASPAA
jgi:hypothetical protein